LDPLSLITSTTSALFHRDAPSGGMVTVTTSITGTEIPDRLFVDVEVTQSRRLSLSTQALQVKRRLASGLPRRSEA
jgi:hypothetical protein